MLVSCVLHSRVLEHSDKNQTEDILDLETEFTMR